MKIHNWEKFNESNISNENKVLNEIVENLGKSNLTDLSFGETYVHFVFSNKPFSISLTDKIGNDYSTISVIVEIDGVTESLGQFDIDEIDEVIDSIKSFENI